MPNHCLLIIFDTFKQKIYKDYNYFNLLNVVTDIGKIAYLSSNLVDNNEILLYTDSE